MKKPDFDSDALAAFVLDKHGKNWWWRKLDPQPWATFYSGKQTLAGQRKAHSESHFLNELLQAAYNYELAARINGGFEFGGDWTTLTDQQKAELATRWPTKSKPGGSSVISIRSTDEDPPPVPRNGWSDYKSLSVNLQRNDETILKTFKQWLDNLRTVEGHKPKRNEGASNRGLEWKAVQLLDIKIHEIRFLNNSERATISTAKRKLKAQF